MTTLLEVPSGARIPIGAPAPWLAAAAAAGWQCECTTPGKGHAKQACGRSHWDDQEHRCRNRAAGQCAMRLVLAPDARGVIRLLCETCAASHTSTAARTAKAAADTAEPADHGQDALFAL